MKRFIRESSAFLIILLLGLAGVQWVIDRGLRNSGYQNFKEWNDITQSRIKANMLIQGSSRAWVHFSPLALDSALGVNSYNLGINGYDFTMQLGRFKTYLEHNPKPDYVLQSLDITSFTKPGDLYMHEQFIPYLNDSIIRTYTSYYNGSFTFKDYYIPLYRYNTSLNTVIAGLASSLIGMKMNNGKIKGFKSQDRPWDNTFERYKAQTPGGVTIKTDSSNWKRFEDFLVFCESRKIKVVLVYAPEYIESQQMTKNRQEIFDRYRSISSRQHLPFFDYSSDSICLSKDNFYNSQHMNSVGVEKFNRKLISDLRGVGVTAKAPADASK